MINRKAIIFGLKGYILTKKEKSLIKKNTPWGIILFNRNIKSISQAQQLVFEIKKITKDKHYPILIDQEGGRVSRINNIINLQKFSQRFFASLYKQNKKKFFIYYKIYIDAVSDLLKKIGVNINNVPVLDVERKSFNKIIGDRAFSKNANSVAQLGKICIDLYKKNKIATVMKHIPGHGLSKEDSHFKTAIINAKKKLLIKKDFMPFKICKPLFAMTAHAIYPIYDRINTATHSKIIIKNIIRGHINFKGIIISDDISMKSLKYCLEENALRALLSGCNLVLHCNGNIKEMLKLSKIIPKIDKFTILKTSQFYKFLG
jgi:beta-N-acetylhexosaminidase